MFFNYLQCQVIKPSKENRMIVQRERLEEPSPDFGSDWEEVYKLEN